MTDKEKAEEYAKNEINKIFVDESDEVYIRASTLKLIMKDLYLKGLAEGRKSKIENPIEKILELKSQIVKLNEYARSICINRKGESECKYHWDCSDCVRWEIRK